MTHRLSRRSAFTPRSTSTSLCLTYRTTTARGQVIDMEAGALILIPMSQSLILKGISTCWLMSTDSCPLFLARLNQHHGTCHPRRHYRSAVPRRRMSGYPPGLQAGQAQSSLTMTRYVGSGPTVACSPETVLLAGQSRPCRRSGQSQGCGSVQGLPSTRLWSPRGLMSSASLRPHHA